MTSADHSWLLTRDGNYGAAVLLEAFLFAAVFQAVYFRSHKTGSIDRKCGVSLAN